MNQKGQALLFVVVAMTIALAVGVNVSLRTLTSLSKTSATDTLSRVRAAAEGGAERFVVRSSTELNALLTVCTNDLSTEPPEECIVDFPANEDDQDNINARAVVKIEEFSANDFTTNTPHYSFNVNENQVAEVNLEGFNGQVQVCWADRDGNDTTGTALYTIAYTTSTDPANVVASKCLLVARNVTVPGSFLSTCNVTNANQFPTYNDCANVQAGSGSNAARVLRVTSIGGDSLVGIMNNPIPVQGYKITSTGSLLQDGEITSRKTVTVYRSFPFLPGIFDYGIYTHADINANVN